MNAILNITCSQNIRAICEVCHAIFFFIMWEALCMLALHCMEIWNDGAIGPIIQRRCSHSVLHVLVAFCAYTTHILVHNMQKWKPLVTSAIYEWFLLIWFRAMCGLNRCNFSVAIYFFGSNSRQPAAIAIGADKHGNFMHKAYATVWCIQCLALCAERRQLNHCIRLCLQWCALCAV